MTLTPIRSHVAASLFSAISSGPLGQERLFVLHTARTIVREGMIVLTPRNLWTDEISHETGLSWADFGY